MRLFESFDGRINEIQCEQLIDKRACIVLSHARSGTHLTIDTIRRNFPGACAAKPVFAPLDCLYCSIDAAIIDPPSSISSRRAATMILRHPFPILKAHWLAPDFTNLRAKAPAVADWIDTCVAKIYVVRRPERVMPSLLVFEDRAMLDAPKWALEQWLERKTDYWVRHVESWTSRADVLTLRFEDIVAAPGATLALLSEKLKMFPCAPADGGSMLPPATGSLWRNRLQRFSAQPASTETLSPSRPPKLETLFSDRAVVRFNSAVARTRHNLGYGEQL